MSTALRSTPLMDTYRRWPVRFVSGDGALLYDDAGREYIDLVAGIAVAVLGHAHPELAAAVTSQMQRLVHVSNLYETEPQQLLAQRLASLTGGMHSFFCNSGAEAVECALKLARRWGGGRRREIVATSNGFHGRTFGALSATGQPSKAEPFAPLLPGVRHVPFDDPAALERVVGEGTAAVLLEPIQGEAGVIVPDAGYLAAARSLCDRVGALLILDEVQTGIGRTGRWFAHHHDGVEPDVLCLAKGLGGGLPIGACLAQPDVAASFQPGDHGSTFGGGPVPARAALVVLEVIERDGLLQRAEAAGAFLRESLASIFGANNVRGSGLLLAVELEDRSARAFAADCLERGLLVNDIGGSVLRLCPPLVVTDAQLKRAISILEEVWDEDRTS